MISMCSFRSSIVIPSLRAISGTWWFCSSRRCSVTIFSVGVPFEPEVADLQPQALLQIARGDADRIERLHVLQRPLDVGDRPLPHRRDLFDRRHEVAVVVEVADDGAADLAGAGRRSVCSESCQSR